MPVGRLRQVTAITHCIRILVLVVVLIGGSSDRGAVSSAVHFELLIVRPRPARAPIAEINWPHQIALVGAVIVLPFLRRHGEWPTGEQLHLLQLVKHRRPRRTLSPGREGLLVVVHVDRLVLALGFRERLQEYGQVALT